MLPSHSMPPTDSWIARQIAELRASLREGLASVAKTLQPQVDGLAAQQIALSDQQAQLAAQQGALSAAQAQLAAQQGEIDGQVAFLLGQIASGRVTATWATNTPAADIVWLPFSATYDATIPVRTSSTGELVVQCGGRMNAWAETASSGAQSWVGLEIRQGGSQVRPPSAEDGNALDVQSTSSLGATAQSVSLGLPLVVSLSPDTEYELRCRRGYVLWGTTSLWVHSTALIAIKLGM